ncbi:MAG: hypothetical protein PHW57_03270 [Candidatus Shapirobacteria bacterium]|nr:hypothetical protein [Candidatus Shapirobacteria bacterium]MDD5074081.1 hypothetical protein [Candidatus Shapirobacteria bacterium]
MKKSPGQALLVVLLVLSVALTAGLSLVARTTTDISVSQKEAESSRAFEAAEAGLEEALKKLEVGSGADFSFSLEGSADANVQFISADDGQLATRTLNSGETATFWLNYFSLDGETFPNDSVSWSGDRVDICWDKDEVVKIEATVYYQEGGNFKAKRYYGKTAGVSCGGDFGQGLEILVSPGSVFNFINVRFYENLGQVRFLATATPNLPAQGTVIVSQGQVADVSRRLQIIRGWPELPDFFDFVLFSGANLAK